MSIDDSYPNLRTKFARHGDKYIRLATHLNVVKHVLNMFSVRHVIEHGMGKGSTPFFHTLSLKTYISFENNPDWMSCYTENCQDHIITKFNGTLCITNPKETLVFVDGQADERLNVLEHAMMNDVCAIVEHDAETFTSEELDARRTLSEKYCYNAYQYVNDNPETALYVKRSVDLDGYVKL